MKTKTCGTFPKCSWPSIGGLAEDAGKTKLSFLFMVVSHFIKQDHNLFCFKVKEKSHLERLISFQEPEQDRFLFHVFCPWVSFAAHEHVFMGH